jgi:hypothetical protein
MSAVDQAYRYAINLPCDWIIVTSMRETRLYHKGSQQHAYERFETIRPAAGGIRHRKAQQQAPRRGRARFRRLGGRGEAHPG